MKNPITWISTQLQQRDNGDLPQWSERRQMWYVRRTDMFFDDFRRALESSMGSSGRRFGPIKPPFTQEARP